MAIRPDYYILNQTLVDPDVAMKHREIISESAIDSPNGCRLFTVTFKQVLQDFGVRNWNGRNYSDKIVMNALNSNPLIQHDLKMGTWTGEYGHPLIDKGMNELARQMTIFPPNACWTINKYWQEGNLLMGECTTLAGGYGDMVRDRILTKYPAMASSRAIGGTDKNGNVLPGYTPITFDCVIRPSHKVAYQVKGSEVMNEFPITTPTKNTMSESVIMINPEHSEALKQFLLDESATRAQICTVCGALGFNADSMVIEENAVKISRMNEDGSMETLIMPLQKLVNASYYNLFK